MHFNTSFPHFKHHKALLILGDSLEVMASLPSSVIHAVVSDPPYGLSFMGNDWDHGVPGEHFWQEAMRLCLPGAHLLAFGGTRTYHRLAVAVEDAGWEIRDQLQWIYGSGFPKSLDVGKAIDKAAGAEREVVGSKISRQPTGNAYAQDTWTKQHGTAQEIDVTAPATDAAKQWDGWGTALKPAHEPICLARKSLEGTVAANVLAHRVGGINVDRCRVLTNDNLNGGAYAQSPTDREQMWGEDAGNSWKRGGAGDFQQPSGRWPANIIHDGSDEVASLFPNDAARFFYCAKASKSERTSNGKVDNKHPTVKPLALMQYLCRLITPPGGLVLDPFVGSGSTVIAAHREGFSAVGIENDVKSFETACERLYHE